jgi:hypothetical protein
VIDFGKSSRAVLLLHPVAPGQLCNRPIFKAFHAAKGIKFPGHFTDKVSKGFPRV